MRLAGVRPAPLAVASVVAAGALATPVQARVSDRDVALSLRVAYDYWASLSPLVHAPGYHCERGAVEARWSRNLGGAMATAKLGGCREAEPIVNLERPTVRRLEDSHACGVITHEFGHLLGYTHNQVKGSIMYSSTDGTPVGLLAPPEATWRRVYRRGYCGRV